MKKNRPQDTQKQEKTGFGTYKKDRKYATILDINVDSSSANSLLADVAGLIDAGRKFLVVTPNPEIVMKAQDDTVLFSILNSAEFSLPDGVGLVWASKFQALRSRLPFVRPSNSRSADGGTGSRTFAPKGRLQSLEPRSNSDGSQNSNSPRALVKRVSGVDVMEKLVKLASEHGWRVFLLGGKPGVAADAARKLKIKSEKLKIQAKSGPLLNIDGEPVNEVEKQREAEVIKRINSFCPHLLFIGFGAPKQEKWVWRNLKQLDVKCAMVVGGAFDYISGYVPRAPLWIQRVGFEWLFRLFIEPWRIKRQLSLFKFVWLVITKG